MSTWVDVFFIPKHISIGVKYEQKTYSITFESVTYLNAFSYEMPNMQKCVKKWCIIITEGQSINFESTIPTLAFTIFWKINVIILQQTTTEKEKYIF